MVNRFTTFLIVAMVTLSIYVLWADSMALQKCAVGSSSASGGTYITSTSRVVTPPVPTFVIVCGKGETNAVQEMEPLLKSMIAMARLPIRFVFFTDPQGAADIKSIFQRFRTDQVLTVEIFLVNVKDILAWCDEIHLQVIHHSGHWGAVKMFVPWLLPHHDRAIVLDTDLLFVTDPVRLWDEFETNGKDWLYKMPIKNMDHPSNMCSCIKLIEIRKVRLESDYYPAVFQKALARHPEWKDPNSSIDHYLAPHGDQGVYYAMIQSNKTLVAPLAAFWNTDRCHNYYNAFGGGQAGILHQNCGQARAQSPEVPFITMYQKYPWSWLHRADVKAPIPVTLANATFTPATGE